MPSVSHRSHANDPDPPSPGRDRASKRRNRCRCPLYAGQNRADVLRQLVRLGATAIAKQQGARRSLVHELAGRYPSPLPARYLESLRDEWPE